MVTDSDFFCNFAENSHLTQIKYTNYQISACDYEIHVEQNFPLPEDETEEKANDLAEVAAQTMSKKSYMKKWRGLTDQEVQEELEQMALERQILEESYSGDLDIGEDIEDNLGGTGDVTGMQDNNIEGEEDVIEEKI